MLTHTHRLHSRGAGIRRLRAARRRVLQDRPIPHKSTKSSSSVASDRTQKPKPLTTNREYVVRHIPTQESWKNGKGEYETRTEWHRAYACQGLSKFARTLQKGQLITLEGTLRYREVETEGQPKQRLAEIHATSMKRLSKVEAADDSTDGADQE